MSFPRAKKMYGQHFLNDPTVVTKILTAADIQPGERVMEIGPGTGVLTRGLIDAGADVVAIEADEDLIDPLQERFGDEIQLILWDALAYPRGEVVKDGTYKLVANLPYNITSDILRSFLTVSPRPSRIVLLLQKEVVERMVARPGQMSLLSVVCQLLSDVSKVTNVPAGAFRPIPKVDSAVVRLDLYEKDAVQEGVLQLARAGFAAKRKQLHKNIASSGLYTSNEMKSALEALEIDPRIRAEALSMDQWKSLHKYLKKPV